MTLPRDLAEPPLLTSKLAVPAPPAGLVERPRLHARLDAGARGPLTLLAAPAGWGKTALLSSWARAVGPVAWLSVEPGDRGDRFWRYLLAALDSSGTPLPGGRPEDGRPTRLADALARLPGPLVLVIDNLDQVGDGVLDGLEFLLRHATPRLRLVVAARTDPALALHRWRLHGGLTELRTGELSFTVDETAQLLARHGVVPAAAYAGELRSRTEGWPAGTRLAALSMQEHPDPARFLRQLTGDDPRIADYLRGELLAGQPAEVRDALLCTSIPQRVCGGLVEALTGRTDGERALAELERSTAFLVRLDARRPEEPVAPSQDPLSWRRYHRLFGELLRAELGRHAPERIPELHRRATGWLAAHGLPLDALRHALAAGEFGQATRVLVENWPHLVRYGHEEPLPAAVAPAPPDALRADPELALAYAVDRLDRGDPEGAGSYLRLADRYQNLLSPDHRDRFALMAVAFRLGQAQAGGDVVGAARAAARMLAVLGRRPHLGAEAIALTAIGTARLVTGELDAAQGALGDGLARAERAGLSCPRLVCASRLAFVQSVRGQLRAAERTAWVVLGTPPCPGPAHPVDRGYAHLALAVVHLERDRLSAAESELISVSDPTDRMLAASAAIARARLLGERGELAQGYEALRAGRRGLGDWRPPRFLDHWFASVEADLRTRYGDTATARRLLEQMPGGAPLAVALARVHLRDGDPHAAARALPDWAGDGAAEHPLPVRLDAGLTEAMAARWLRDDRRAHRALERVLQLAEPDGFRRVFTRAGAPVRELLLDHLDSGTAYWSMVAGLLAATDGEHAGGERAGGEKSRAGPPPPVPGEPLTDRELTILRFLPSMLSNVEIAGALCLSVNTVKTHVRHIYRKLHATRRRDAVRRARDLHLL